MLTCPECDRDMHPTCGRKTCVCFTRIPQGELPMRNKGSLFGRVDISARVLHIFWYATWYLNVGWWIDKLIWKTSRKLSHFSKYLGFSPYQYLIELQECAYCGYDNTYDYWADREITQTFPNGMSFASRRIENETILWGYK